jgi:hypothetical protein
MCNRSSKHQSFLNPYTAILHAVSILILTRSSFLALDSRLSVDFVAAIMRNLCTPTNPK